MSVFQAVLRTQRWAKVNGHGPFFYAGGDYAFVNGLAGWTMGFGIWGTKELWENKQTSRGLNTWSLTLISRRRLRRKGPEEVFVGGGGSFASRD